MFVAGIHVHDELILELARLVDDDLLADRLETAYGREVKVPRARAADPRASG